MSPVLGMTPYGAVQFQDSHTPSYGESDATGGGFGLADNAMNATDVHTEPGSRFEATTLLDGKPLLLSRRPAWAHDAVSPLAMSAVFESLPGASFTVLGAPIPRVRAPIADRRRRHWRAARHVVIGRQQRAWKAMRMVRSGRINLRNNGQKTQKTYGRRIATLNG